MRHYLHLSAFITSVLIGASAPALARGGRGSQTEYDAGRRHQPSGRGTRQSRGGRHQRSTRRRLDPLTGMGPGIDQPGVPNTSTPGIIGTGYPERAGATDRPIRFSRESRSISYWLGGLGFQSPGTSFPLEVRSAIFTGGLPIRATRGLEALGDDNSGNGRWSSFSGIHRRRYSRLHRPVGRLGGYRPLPVLCLCRDLPGAADFGTTIFRFDGLAGLSVMLRETQSDEAIQAASCGYGLL